MPTGRGGLVVGVVNSLLYAAGGQLSDGSETKALEVYTSVLPFAAFTAEVEINLTAGAFEVEGTFTLGAGSDGIKPLTEAVKLQVGTFSTTIPAGSFTQDEEGRFEFEGVISGVSLEVKITPLGGDTFAFEAEGTGANLTGTVNPVTVGLTIGDDGGTTTVTAEFD